MRVFISPWRLENDSCLFSCLKSLTLLQLSRSLFLGSRGNTVDLNRSFKRSSSFKVPEHRDEEVKLEKEMITAEPEDSSERTSFSVVVKVGV